MKTKKILAIVTLVAFMVSILPMAAFAGDYSTYGSVVSVETSSASAVSDPSDTTKDGLEYEVTLVASAAQVTGVLYAQTNRGSTDKVYYKNAAGVWTAMPADGFDVSTLSTATDKVVSVDIKILSNIAGNVKVAFGIVPLSVSQYVTGKEISSPDGIGDIIGQKLYDGTFTSAKVSDVELTAKTSGSKAANGVTYHEVEAYVEAAGYPANGVDVEFSLSGTGATLSASKVKTGVNGKASVKITATKPGDYKITAKSDKIESNELTLKFSSTGIVDIKAESDNNQKIAIDGNNKTFKYSLYDIAGNKVSIDSLDEIDGFEVDVTTKPSGSNFDVETSDFSVSADGLLVLTIDTDDLDKDGNYAIRVNLVNGKVVTYQFSAKEQGDVVSMEIEYDASSYAAESFMGTPTVKYADAEGYKTEGAPTSDVKFSVSDSKFIDYSKSTAQGAYTLSDEMGTFVVTAVDTDKELVATVTITVGKAASGLKITAPTFTAIGETAEVTIQVVDADGKAVATRKSFVSGKAIVLSKPTGAVVSVGTIDSDDYASEGKATVDVDCNIAGNVVIQVVIEEAGGKTFTGSASVAFGEAAAANKTLIMFIGSTNYIVGNQPAITDAAPYIKDGRTYVAVRPIGDALGSTIYWDAATQTVTLVKPGETVTIVIGSSVIKVDRAGVVTEYPTDAPAHIKDGRTYLPFRAIGEAMGYTVTWDAATQAVIFS